MTFAALLLACSTSRVDDARTAWMRDVLARDNAVWLARDHALLATKYARMAEDPYDFMRGTATLFHADVSVPEPERATTRFLDAADAVAVLLAGDPHPENLGTLLPGEDPAVGVLPGEPPSLELIDLDGAAFGPWIVDVRRGALGLATLLDAAPTCDEACVTASLTAYARGYAKAVGAPGRVDCWSHRENAAAAALCDEVEAEGQEQAALAKWTLVEQSPRRWRLDEALDGEGKGLLAATEEERQRAERLVALLPGAPVRVLDLARRYGMGVASLPAERLVVLYDTGDDGPGDDRMLQLREVIDPPAPPGRLPSVPALFDDNADRIERASRLLWSRPDADPRMAGRTDAGVTFKASTFSSWCQGFEHEALAEADAATLEALGALLGEVLGGTHARGLTVDGARAGIAIAGDLDGQTDALAEELLRDAADDRARLQADHTRFVAALEVHGPLLGADLPAQDVAR